MHLLVILFLFFSFSYPNILSGGHLSILRLELSFCVSNSPSSVVRLSFLSIISLKQHLLPIYNEIRYLAVEPHKNILIKIPALVKNYKNTCAY